MFQNRPANPPALPQLALGSSKFGKPRLGRALSERPA